MPLPGFVLPAPSYSVPVGAGSAVAGGGLVGVDSAGGVGMVVGGLVDAGSAGCVVGGDDGDSRAGVGLGVSCVGLHAPRVKPRRAAAAPIWSLRDSFIFWLLSFHTRQFRAHRRRAQLERAPIRG